MNIKKYIKRIFNAILNRPLMIYTTEKEYSLSSNFSRELQNQVALVTGASGAIGGAIAWKLAATN